MAIDQPEGNQPIHMMSYKAILQVLGLFDINNGSK
jgi:hypothetical protein